MHTNSIARAFLNEFELQARFTRKFLERLPENRLTWKPHPRSMTAGQLAYHLATMPAVMLRVAEQNPAQMMDEVALQQPISSAEILSAFEATRAHVPKLLAKFDDAAMMDIWRLKAGDCELLAVPRMSFVRDTFLSHWYQHRGQFSVYLRMLDVSVPAVWGPSADELPTFQEHTETLLTL